MSKHEEYLLDFLMRIYPKCRTMTELEWWFVTMDEQGNFLQMKTALKSLRRRGLVAYVDPTGWKAMNGEKQ